MLILTITQLTFHYESSRGGRRPRFIVMTRFEKIAKDPRFRPTKSKQTKVVVDERFKGVFEDPKFTQPYTVDKYGRRLDTKEASKKEMKRFYRLESDEDKSEAEEAEEQVSESAESSEDYSSSSDDSSSDSEESVVDDTLDQAFSQHPLVAADVPLGDATRRLALVNMDWDQLKAVDIFVLLTAFKPTTGLIKSVKIYPSEFGKERIAREAIEGPPRDIFKVEAKETEPVDEEDSDSDVDPLKDLKKTGTLTEETSTFNQSALRRYQLERLRYYYAVIECDTVETAASIYLNCDGREFESSTSSLDLRYIPDDVEFDEAEVTDCATRIPKKYAPKQSIVTDALQCSSVKLTWDQDDPDRKRLTRVNLSRDVIEEADLRAYLASDSEDDIAAEEARSKEDKIAKYRALLLNNGKEDVFGRRSHQENDQLDITFTSGIMQQVSESEDEGLKQDFDEERVAVFDAEGNLVEQVTGDKEIKKSDKKEKKSSSGSKKSEKFVLEKDWSKQSHGKKMRRKREADDEEKADFKVDLQDDRFKAVFDEPAFAIDPTASNFKRTKNMDAIIAERQRRKRASDRK